MTMIRFLVLTTLTCAFLAVGPASAQDNPVVSVDENGAGSIVFTVPPQTSSTAGVLTSDPGPGGLSSALTYDLHGPHPGLVAGDVILTEGLLGGPQIPSEVLRFNPFRIDAAGHVI